MMARRAARSYPVTGERAGTPRVRRTRASTPMKIALALARRLAVGLTGLSRQEPRPPARMLVCLPAALVEAYVVPGLLPS
jgi:hypothetical protein